MQSSVGVVVAYQTTFGAAFNLEFYASDTTASVRVDDIAVEGNTLWIAGGVENYAGPVTVSMKDHAVTGAPVIDTSPSAIAGTVGAWFLASIDLDGSNGSIDIITVFDTELTPA